MSEIGASTTIDRGALGDTMIAKAASSITDHDPHNAIIGRHCVIAGQTALPECVLEDGVVLAGQVGLGDHTRVGAKARWARVRHRVRIFLEGGRIWRRHRRNL